MIQIFLYSEKTLMKFVFKNIIIVVQKELYFVEFYKKFTIRLGNKAKNFIAV